MRKTNVNPRILVLDKAVPPQTPLKESVPRDLAVKEDVKENGLDSTNGALPLVAIRIEEGLHKVVSGAKYVRAILDLMDEDSECYNRRTGKIGKACDVYEVIEVGIMG